jgi:NhaP-type Na+/H+ or K+/H+ antiporter
MFKNIETLVIPLSLTIIISYVFASFAIHRYKLKYGKAPWIHESSIAALLGLIAGGFVKLTTGLSIKFDNNIFFYLVLPPVIFSAGFTLKRRKFFQYMHYISIFGIMILYDFSIVI